MVATSIPAAKYGKNGATAGGLAASQTTTLPDNQKPGRHQVLRQSGR